MLTRRRMIAVLGSSSLVAAVSGRKAGAVMFQRPVLTEYGPTPIAIPTFVPGSPSDGDFADNLTSHRQRSEAQRTLCLAQSLDFRRAHHRFRYGAAICQLEEDRCVGA